MRVASLLTAVAMLAGVACSDETPLEPGGVRSGEMPSAQAPPSESIGFAAGAGRRHLRIEVDVTNPVTGERIGRRIPPGTPFQVTVVTNEIDCAGQFVVTALGASGSPPSVLVAFSPFIIGPAVGSNQAGGGTLIADGIGNDWKVTASCNGAEPGQHAFDFYEFFVQEE